MMMKNKPRKIRWGIIGLGSIANKFATDLLTIEDAELYAVASRSEEKVTKFSEKYNAKIAYNSYEDLAKDSNIDAVYIATPHSFHKAHSILCMQHKKAVLCEKPFAMDVNEVEEMIAVAKENKVLLMEALWTYFLPHYKYVLELIKSEKFGKVEMLEADFGFKPKLDFTSRVFKKELGGGSLLDIGIYPIFVALSSLGNPNSIKANATFFENGVDSSCNIIFNYSDKKAVLKSTFLKQTNTEAVFSCEKAIIKINTKFHEPSTVTIIQNGKEEIKDFGYKTIGYNFETEHFNQLLREHKTESDIMTFDFSRNLIKTLDKIRGIIGLKY